MNDKIKTRLENPDVQQGCAKFFMDRIGRDASDLSEYCDTADLTPEEMKDLLIGFLLHKAGDAVSDYFDIESFWRHW